MNVSNPLSNGHIVSVNTDPRDYHGANAPRGSKEFVMSRSQLWDFGVCPSRWRDGHESKGSKATEKGEVWDCLVLQGEAFESRFAVTPETYPAPAKHAKVKSGEIKEGDPLPWHAGAAFCGEWIDECKAEGKEIVSTPVYEQAKAAYERLLKSDRARDMLEGSERQVFVQAEYSDPSTGIVVPVKGLIDFVPPMTARRESKTVCDLKTARDAGPKWFRSAFGYGYQIQAAMYLDAYNLVRPHEGRNNFLFLVQETEPPFQTGRKRVMDDMLAVGRKHYSELLALYCQCLAKDRWPDYDEDSPWNGASLWEPEAWMIEASSVRKFMETEREDE